MIRIGIDIGGTFTDICVIAGDAPPWSTKILSTPRDPSVGFLDILNRAIESNPHFGDVREIVHATTVATNAILEMKTARLGLITTAGFRDVLEIGRHLRRDLYNFFLQKPPVLVPRERRIEVDERIGADGAVIKALDGGQVRAAAEALLQQGVEVILICFLNSYADARHELEAAEIVRRRCDVPVITSHSVCGEFREYERFSTAAVHGSVLPMVRNYIEHVRAGLSRKRVNASLSIMQSNGGMAGAPTVMQEPGSIIESGPAAGAISAVEVGRRLNTTDLISFDMGGTTTKATLVRGGRIEIDNDYEVGGGIQGGFGTGYPIRTPVVDLVEIGTGGGSIAFINEAGHLNVGPRSSGAAPGPACYGLGGSEPAITDADVVLGRLSSEHFAGGRMRLDVKAAERAIERCIAAPLGIPVIRAAESIAALANAQMVRALELVSVERGFDPRSFALVAFGGAGPMHAAELALELRCPRAIIPLSPGVQSAWGLLVADARRDFSRTILRNRGAIDLAYLRQCHEAMAEQGGRDLVAAGFDSSSIQCRLALGARYVGQAYEVIVEIPSPYSFDEKMRGEIDSLFHAEHRRLYGYASAGAPVEWVTLRTTVISKIPYPAPRKIPPADLPLNARTLGRQPMIWNGHPFDAPVFHRSALGCGDRMTGPLLVVQDDTSIPVPPGVELSVVETGDIILETERSA